MSRKHSDDGASLIIVLAVFGGLLTMVLALLPSASTNIVSSARFKSHVDKSYAADGGLKQALKGGAKDSSTGLTSAVLPDGTSSCSSLFGKTITLNGQTAAVTCEFAGTYPKPGIQSTCPTPSGTSAVLTPAYTCYVLYGNQAQALTTTAGAPAQKEVKTDHILVPRGDLDVVFLVDTTNGMNATGNAAINELKKDSVLSQLFDDMPTDARYRVAQYRDFTSPNQWNGTTAVSCPTWTTCSGVPYTISPSWMVASDAKNYFKSSSFLADPGTQDENAEAGLYGLYRVLKDPGLWRASTTRAVIWIGDTPSHTPICQALDTTNIAVSAIDKTTIGGTGPAGTPGGMVANVQMFSISLSTNGTGLDNLNANTSNNELAGRCNTASGNAVKDQATYIDARGATGSRHYSNVTVAQLAAQIHTILESLKPAYVTSTVSGTSCVSVSPDAVADEDGKARFNESFQAVSGMSGTLDCDVTFKIYDPKTTPPTLKEVDVEKNRVTVIPSLQINFTVTIDGKIAARSQATYDLFDNRAITINSWHLL